MAEYKANKNKKKSNGKSKQPNIGTILLSVILIAITILYISKNKEKLQNEIIGDSSDIVSEATVPEYSESYSENENSEEISGNFYAYVLDVGQADCILLKTPNSKYVLIDAGVNTDKEKVLNKLKTYNIKTIEYFILTHPHADHIGAAAEVINTYDVKNVIMTDKTTTSATYNNLITALENHEEVNVIEGTPGLEFKVDTVSFTVLSPLNEYTDLNKTSIVLRASYGDTNMLFMGDAETENESDILGKYSNDFIKADFIKIGHHGSSSSSSYGFIKAVSPKYAAISCGEDNSYGHPHKETISTLKKLNVEYYITYESGDIIAYTDGKELKLTTQN